MTKNEQLMLPVPKHRPRARTISVSPELSAQLRTASRYLGISSHKLIQLGIRHELESVYGQMQLDAESK